VIAPHYSNETAGIDMKKESLSPMYIYFLQGGCATRAQLINCTQCQVLKSITCTHTHTQPFCGSMDFVLDNPGELVPEETFTHYI